MTAWKELIKPTVGTPVKKSQVDDIIDDLNFLYANGVGSGGGGSSSYYSVANGGMELDGDGDGIPDLWEFTPLVGGDGAMDSNESVDGEFSFRIDSPGGASNGGGELVYPKDDYIPIQQSVRYFVKWWMKATVANMKNRVEMLRYDVDKNYIDTVVLFDYETGNPLTWTLFARWTDNPSNARYCKLKFTGGVAGHATGGTVYFDAIDFFIPQLITTVVKTASETYTHPEYAVFADCEVYGGGGGGGATGGTSGVSGGDGEDGNKSHGIVRFYGLTTAITVGGGGLGSEDGSPSSIVGGGPMDTVSALGGKQGVDGSSGAGSYVGISGRGGTGYVKGNRGQTQPHGGGIGGNGGVVMKIYGARG